MALQYSLKIISTFYSLMKTEQQLSLNGNTVGEKYFGQDIMVII